MKKIPLLLCAFVLLTSFGPPNCNLFKHDEMCYKACLEAEKAIQYAQGSKPSQIHFDQSIEYCPTFAYSHYEKAVPYLKRGLMTDYANMMEQAVELEPKEFLSHRGWCHFQFMKNYEAAIADIERLDDLLDYDIGHTGNGEYHLHVTRALCYKGLGNKTKAIEIIEELLGRENHEPGLYVYFHLGVLYAQTNAFDNARAAFKKQLELYDFASIHYYLAEINKKENKLDEALDTLDHALAMYKQDRILNNGYTNYVDKVYKQEMMDARKAWSK